jgi:peptidyl-prolyl cis-trans isomerase D
MRALADKKIFKSLLGLVVISFIILGIGDVFKGKSTDIAVVIDGKHKITTLELKRQMRNEISRIENSSGLNLDEDQIEHLKMIVLEQMINGKLLEIETNQLGIKLSDETIVDFLKNQQAFKNEQGDFDRNRFDNILKSVNLSEIVYINLLKKELSTKFLIDSISTQFINPNLLAPYAYRYNNQTRIVDLVTMDHKDLVKDPTPSPEEIKKYYDDNMKLFSIPEYRSFSCLEVLAKNMQVDVSQEEIKKEYDDSASDYPDKKFPDVKEIIKSKLVSQKSDSKLYELMQVIEDEFASGSTIEEIATKHQVEVKEFVDIDKSGKDRSNLVKITIDDSDLLNTVFSNDDIITSPVAMKSDHSGFFIAKLTNITPSSIKSFDLVKEQASDMLVNLSRKNLALDVAKDIKKQLADGKLLDSLPYKFTINHNISLMRNEATLPVNLITNIFKLKLGEVSEIFEFQDKIIMAIVKNITNKELDKTDPTYSALNDQIKLSLSNDAMGEYIVYLRKKHKVKVSL